MKIERRSFPVDFRAEDVDGVQAIVGHAAVFNSWSEDLGGFREQVAPGAFNKTLQEADVRALFNHDPNYVLGRVKAETLELAEDETGLAIRAVPPDTQWARDLAVSLERGDIDQMSFGFQVIKDEWEGQDRTLLEVRLFDVSVVTFAAYPDTEAHLRSLMAAIETETDEPPQEGHSDEDTDTAQPSESVQEDHSVALGNMRRRLELIKAI